MMQNFKQLLGQVNTLIFDMDGVLTDGSITIMPNGEHVRAMNIKDGYAMQLAVKKGYRVVIISGGKSDAAKLRFSALGITDIYLGVPDKRIVFEELITLYDLNPATTLYMGDDIPDYEVMKLCGVPTCPADAASDIKEISIYISDKKGGKGCVRDVIEQVMRLNAHWVTD
jgi:3-deoxy-D-manno-octulosonate 8-phosphate phosphatase (KDO 8-P phosphatase)